MKPEKRILKGKRERMVARQIRARGIKEEKLLEAFREVPREAFVPVELEGFAYEDVALQLSERHVIPRPYIAARFVEALQLKPTDHVLVAGVGSGYTVAVISRMVDSVVYIEEDEALIHYAREVFETLGYTNIETHVQEITAGWPPGAPYQAILIGEELTSVPEVLKQQLLAPGGRLVLPLGKDWFSIQLVRIVRETPKRFRMENLGPFHYVPEAEEITPPPRVHRSRKELIGLIREEAVAFPSIEGADLSLLLDRIGQARVVLLGEATHGTSEFYRMRQEITRALIEEKGFTIIAVEADWPDAERIDDYVRGVEYVPRSWQPFERFPTWMWRNLEVLEFVEWLRLHNEKLPYEERVGFYGLDLYSLFTSIHEVLRFLERTDPELARQARTRYACLMPFESDPALYGRAVISQRYRECEDEVVEMLGELLKRRMELVEADREAFFRVLQNARIIANAERYYRAMYYGAAESWNLRDEHMFGTLEALLAYHGANSKAVVWAHNSHVGDAAATEMFARGEINIGHLCRESFGSQAFIIGFGTHTGTVAAASYWGGVVELKEVRPSHPKSYERLAHETGLNHFFLHLREPDHPDLRPELNEPRLERAIGVIYRPETELQSHYFQAMLPEQFDEYIFFDETRAVTPLGRPHAPELPETHPFALLD